MLMRPCLPATRNLGVVPPGKGMAASSTACHRRKPQKTRLPRGAAFFPAFFLAFFLILTAFFYGFGIGPSTGIVTGRKARHGIGGSIVIIIDGRHAIFIRRIDVITPGHILVAGSA